VENLPVLQDPIADPNQEIDLRRYWMLLARSAWIIVVCVGLAVAAATTAVRRIQPVYVATATVRIEDKSQGQGPAAMYYFGGADYQALLAQASEVITSRTLASKVVDALGLRIGVEQPQRNAVIRSLFISEARTEPDAPSDAYRFVKVPAGHEVRLVTPQGDSLLGTYSDTGVFPILGGVVRLTGEAKALERIGIRLIPRIDAAEGLRGSIEVGQQNKDANVLSITYRGPDADLTRDIPNAVARAFVQRRMELDRSGATARIDYLMRQRAVVGADISAAEDSIQQFLEDNEIASVGQFETALASELTSLRLARADIDKQRQAVRGALRASVPNDTGVVQAWLRQLFATPEFAKSGIATGEAARLESLIGQRNELSTTLLPRADRVAAIDSQIQATQRTIRERAEQYVGVLDRDYAAMTVRIDSVSSQLQLVPELALAFGKLERNRKILEEMMTLVQSQLKEAEIASAVTDSTASVLDDAVTPSQQSGSSETLIYAVAIISGLAVGIAVAFLRDWLDTTIRSEKDLAAVVGVTVVGIIPNLQQQSRSAGYRLPSAAGAGDGRGGATAGREYQTPAAEAYRTLRTNLNYLTPPRPPRVIVITSALPGDGKTTTTVNLAVTLAHQGQRVILIDAETRRGTVHEVFGIPPSPGFFDLMYGQASPGECIRRVQMEGGGTIDVLPLGSAPSVNPADLLVAARLQPLFERLRGQYEYVFLDTPPLNLFTDAALIGAHADALLLVARADKTDRDELRYAVQQLRNVQVTLAGTILNDVEFRRSSRYRLGYGYYYDYAR
jgi:capsular exopolysaccharide synthesis family protein